MEDSTPQGLSGRLREAGVLAEGAVASLIVTLLTVSYMPGTTKVGVQWDRVGGSETSLR